MLELVTDPKTSAAKIFCLIAMFAALPAWADETPTHIDVGSLPAKDVAGVVVPVPSEVFGVLDKLGSPNWHEVLRSTKSNAIGERPQVALMLGTVIAEGFIAVEAQESEEVKKIGSTVLKLAAAIGVQKSVIARSNSIREWADKKDWTRVRSELDGALQDVKQAMHELGDEQLAQLVSLGGWLRGTEALTSIVAKNYSRDGAELLHQPLLLDYFQKRLDTMEKRLKNNSVVTKIHKRLAEIRPLVANGNAQISAKSVDQIHEITQDLVKSVSAKES
ncbi:MAG: hypothetical protein M3O82_02435 [Verrucomicrobiota bacterium]|nr:hypothetical protein [Verrucomicrobiota bacterium]